MDQRGLCSLSCAVTTWWSQNCVMPFSSRSREWEYSSSQLPGFGFCSNGCRFATASSWACGTSRIVSWLRWNLKARCEKITQMSRKQNNGCNLSLSSHLLRNPLAVAFSSLSPSSDAFSSEQRKLEYYEQTPSTADEWTQPFWPLCIVANAVVGWVVHMCYLHW